jgi:transposase
VQYYTESFKRKMVQRMLMPDGPSATALSGEIGVSQSALSRWLREAKDKGRTEQGSPRNAGTVGTEMKRRPEDWGWEEKLRVVAGAKGLKGEELGAYLRREGLHEVQLREWEMAIREGLKPRGRKPTHNAADVKRIKELERELRRKEKALAEAAALLVLKKKLERLWGDEDGDTKERRGK